MEKDYRRARMVSSMDSQRAQQIAYELDWDLHNIDVFQTNFKDCIVIMVGINILQWDNL